MEKCPYCDYKGFLKIIKEWNFRFYTVKMYKCLKCKGVFNYYLGISPKTGKKSEFYIRIKPRPDKR